MNLFKRKTFEQRINIGQHGLFCECKKCLPSSAKHRKIIRELKQDMTNGR